MRGVRGGQCLTQPTPGNMSREVTFPCSAISLDVADLHMGSTVAGAQRQGWGKSCMHLLPEIPEPNPLVKMSTNYDTPMEEREQN